MRVYVNDKHGKRKLVDAHVVKRNPKTVWVELPSGSVVKRKLARDVPPGEEFDA